MKIHQHQRYIFDTAKELNVPARIVRLERPAASTSQIAKCLGVPLEQVIHTRYYSNGCHTVGIAYPESEHEPDSRRILMSAFVMEKYEAASYKNSFRPCGMEINTTPFPLRHLVGRDRQINDIILYDMKRLKHSPVITFLGDRLKDPERTFLKTTGKGMYEILSKNFSLDVWTCEP